LWRFGFEISLELGVFLFQLGDSFALLFAFLLLLMELPPQALNFALLAVDLLAQVFEENGTTTRTVPRERKIPRWLSSGVT